MQNRYSKLLDLVREAQPNTIVEIGVWNGRRACQMVSAALEVVGTVHYIGYDLFEEASEQTDKEEFNLKSHNSMGRVMERLGDFAKTHPSFSYELRKGNTRQTLEHINADFTYIDGGHSLETIRHDYEMTKGSKMIVFDDYYLPDAEGKCPDLELFGANKIVDPLEPEIINTGDKVGGGGLVCLAVLRNNNVYR